MSDVYISKSNSKVKCNLFSLPSEVTCRHDVQCGSYCYAKKAERCYKQVLPRRHANLEASKDNTFKTLIISELSKRRNPVTRIHESGDFYNRKYLMDWFEICDIMKPSNKTFYAYTKRHDIITKELLKYKPDNLKLIYSIDGLRQILSDGTMPNSVRMEVHNKLHEGYDKVAIVNDGEYTNCPGTAGGDTKCIQNCRLCIDNETKIIVFKKH